MNTYSHSSLCQFPLDGSRPLRNRKPVRKWTFWMSMHCLVRCCDFAPQTSGKTFCSGMFVGVSWDDRKPQAILLCITVWRCTWSKNNQKERLGVSFVCRDELDLQPNVGLEQGTFRACYMYWHRSSNIIHGNIPVLSYHARSCSARTATDLLCGVVRKKSAWAISYIMVKDLYFWSANNSEVML